MRSSPRLPLASLLDRPSAIRRVLRDARAAGMNPATELLGGALAFSILLLALAGLAVVL